VTKETKENEKEMENNSSLEGENRNRG